VRVFISSDRRHRFFIDVACEAVDMVNSQQLGEPYEAIFPPRLLGVDTGKMLADVLPILDAEVVLINVTPSKLRGRWTFNTGVMIEYGMTLGRSRATKEISWPKPYYRVFCNQRYALTKLPPMLNEERVNKFATSKTGRVALRGRFTSILKQALADRARAVAESQRVVTRTESTFAWYG
jgi:hypothetical protein